MVTKMKRPFCELPWMITESADSMKMKEIEGKIIQSVPPPWVCSLHLL